MKHPHEPFETIDTAFPEKQTTRRAAQRKQGFWRNAQGNFSVRNLFSAPAGREKFCHFLLSELFPLALVIGKRSKQMA